MRKLTIFLTIIFSVFVLNSCDDSFSIFSEDGKEVTVVYGYLDVEADTDVEEENSKKNCKFIWIVGIIDLSLRRN